jgi:hypothetical protein
MKQIILYFALLFLVSFNGFTQQVSGKEFGIEGYASASNVGGNYGIGIKIGAKFGENFVVGPSFRLMHGWSKNLSVNYDYNIYGGGIYAHYRYGNVIFLGVETEVLHSPFNFGMYTTTAKHWVPTFFIGGGLSREFRDKFRLNAGIFYDAVNSLNSPFRPTYKTTKTNPTTGQITGYVPIIYRINLFIRFGDPKEDEVDAEEEL